MIKKITAYSFLFLANIILLAHAVIPHHHHDQQVCFERRHIIGDEVAPHNTPEQDHRHDRNTNSSACILKQAVIIPSTPSRILKGCDNCTDIHNHDLYILSNFGYSDLQPVSIIVTSFPEFTPFLKSFVTSTPGLRAPPIV